MPTDEVPYTGVTFAMDDGNRRLLARTAPDDIRDRLTPERLKRMLANEGYSGLFLLSDAFDRLIELHNTGTEGSVILGEQRDGSCTVTLSADLMQAFLTISPAYGGTPAARALVDKALAEQGVIFGIDNETCTDALTKGAATNRAVAEGSPPLPGEDAQFISLVREANAARLSNDDDAIIDYRSFCTIVTVKAGDPLMRRIPATVGTPGKTVLGTTVAAPRGIDLPFSSQTEGVVIHENDPDLLVAAIAGQPVMLPDGVSVEPIITIKDVNLSTGNLDIEGSLTITGDVKPGMHITATADILIEGVVEGGHIVAAGNVEVRGAIIGQGEPRSFDGEINPLAATVRCEGFLMAPFVENAVISAGGDIVLRDFVMNSELNAGDSILIGESGSNKGRIINSLCRATGSIEAVTIGSRSGAGTILEVGIDPDVHNKCTQAQHLLQIREREWDEATKALEYFREHPDRTSQELVQEKEKILAQLTTEIQELSGQVRLLKKRFDQLGDASITAAHQVFAGVRITIGEQTIQLENDLPGTTFSLDENGLLQH